MILFVSDIHLGRCDAATERANEKALIDCLEAHEREVDRLYLVGDVFDQYIEYRDLAPKGFVRFQGLLARWTDAGIPIKYLLGNHDPWHRTYFKEELGVDVSPGPLEEMVDGTDLYLYHGDGLDPSDRVSNWLRPVLRHPLSLWAYTSLLPGDAGFGLATRTRTACRKNEEVKRSCVDAMRAHAHTVLTDSSAQLVVMGHSHHPELSKWPEGCYLNPGFWHKSRTFGSLNKDVVQLLRWNGSCTEVIKDSTIA
ncbi:MAG TPA: UDP-2,3-diacylglucosamine diphosphatase [Rhodothermales bacterium]|nr:UDP-2,3-diacylglucosamine diphosphatase [Rhodothermales bacterium]